MNKKIKKLILKFIPIRNIIVFESIPDFSDNSFAVYKEFVDRKLDEKYRLVWLSTKSKTIDGKKIKVINDNNRFEHIKKLYYFFTAKCFISSNRHLGSLRDEQTSFFLNHGTPLKSVKDYYSVKKNITYNLAASECAKEILCKETKSPIEKTFVTGYARNDELFIKKDIKKIFNTNCKIIAWYPTYRQHKTSNKCVYNMNSIPIIDCAEKAKELNDYLINKNVILVIKPHYVQNVDYIKKFNFSNIIFIDDDFFNKNNITSYEFLGNTDSLISDYSSVVFDYYLCDKPICLIWEDLDIYLKTPGLIENYDEFTNGTYKIYNFCEFKKYIDDISKGRDVYKEDRNNSRSLLNCSNIPDNTKRTVDFIIEKGKL